MPSSLEESHTFVIPLLGSTSAYHSKADTQSLPLSTTKHSHRTYQERKAAFVPSDHTKWEPLIPWSRPKPEAVKSATSENDKIKGYNPRVTALCAKAESIKFKFLKEVTRKADRRPWSSRLPAFIIGKKAQLDVDAKSYQRTGTQHCESQIPHTITCWHKFVASRQNNFYKGAWVGIKAKFTYQGGRNIGKLGCDWKYELRYNGDDVRMLKGEKYQWHGGTSCYCVEYKTSERRKALFAFAEFARIERVGRPGLMPLKREERSICSKCLKVYCNCKQEVDRDERPSPLLFEDTLQFKQDL